VADWTFGVNRSKDHVFHRYRVFESTQFLNWNLDEKVASIESHHGEFVVMTLEAVNNGRAGLNHCHLIVIHDDNSKGQFDFEELLNNLHAANNVEVAEDLSRLFGNFQKKAVQTMTRRYNTILKSLEKLALEGKRVEPTRRKRPIHEPDYEPISSSGGRGRSGSHGASRGTSQGGSRGNGRGLAQADQPKKSLWIRVAQFKAVTT